MTPLLPINPIPVAASSSQLSLASAPSPLVEEQEQKEVGAFPRTRVSLPSYVAAGLGALAKPNGGGVFLFRMMPALYGLRDRAINPGRDVEVLTWVSCLGSKIDARWYAGAGHDLPTVVAWTGNGESADQLDPQWQELRAYANILVVNQLGSSGTEVPKDLSKTELYMLANAQRAEAFIRAKNVKPSRVVWYGFSLGGTQAVTPFKHMPGSHLVLHNTLTSARGIGAAVGRPVLGRLSTPVSS